MLSGKVILRVNLLDNAQKTLLVEPTTTVQDVIRIMADKLGFANPADDCLNCSLHEVKDGVTSKSQMASQEEVSVAHLRCHSRTCLAWWLRGRPHPGEVSGARRLLGASQSLTQYRPVFQLDG